MARYARIENDVVAEIIELPDGTKLADALHPDIVVNIRPAGDNVYPGFVLTSGLFVPPAPPPPPEPKRQLSFIEFLDLFTESEQLAAAASNDPQVRRLLLRAAGASSLSLDDTRTLNGLESLVSQGLLTAERKSQILTGQAPA